MSGETQPSGPTNLIDEVKDLLPEIDFSGIQAVTETREQMQSRLDSMEKSIQSLTEVLGETVKLYEATKNETKLLQEHHLTSIAHASKATVSVGKTMMDMLTIDYERLVLVMAQKGIIDQKKLTKTLKETVEKTAELDEFAEKVAKSVVIDDIDYDELVQTLDYSEIMQYFDPHDYWDTSDIASHYDPSDIAYYVAESDVAEHIEVDEVAQNIDIQNVADHLDMEALINHIDLDAIVQQVKASMGEEE